MTNARVYWLHTLSPTHVGSGRGLGYIDLPIQRERVTNWPVIPGSAFKGVWRDWAEQQGSRNVRLAFGPEVIAGSNESNSGALIPTDARLVCLPVRSLQGTLAWCTSALALALLRRDLELAGMKDLPGLPAESPPDTVHHAHATKLVAADRRVYLEDLDLAARPSAEADAWANRLAGWVFPGEERAAWRTRFVERFAVVPDEIFDFLTETGTEVAARIRIDDELKSVAKGALWQEEALPAETILAGLVVCDRIYSKDPTSVAPQALLRELATEPLTLQIGGKATVGRGRVRCVFTPVGG